MSAKIKRASVYGVRIFAAALFIVLMLFNIQVGFDAGSASDIKLLGIRLSALLPTSVVYAAGGGTCCPEAGSICETDSGKSYFDYYWRTDGKPCKDRDPE